MTITLENLEEFFNIENVHESDFAVFGRKGRGKTLIMVIEGYLHYKDGLTVYSNFPLHFPHVLNEHMIFDYEELQDAVILIDEFKSCNNAKNLISQVVIKGRKKHLFFYFSAQKQTFIDNEIREQCVRLFPRFNSKKMELSLLRIAIDEFGQEELKYKKLKIYKKAFEFYDTEYSPKILTLEDKLKMILQKSGCTLAKTNESRERLKINLEINYGDKKERAKILADYDKGDLDYLIELDEDVENKSNREIIYEVKGYQLKLLKQEKIKDERFYNDAITELNSRFANRNITLVFDLFLNGYEKEAIAKHYKLQLKTVENYIRQCFDMLTRKRNNQKLSIVEKLYYKHLKEQLGHLVQTQMFKGKHVDYIDHNYKKVISFKCYKETNLLHGIKRIALSEIEVAIDKSYDLLFVMFDFRKREFSNLHFAITSLNSGGGV